MQGKQWEVLGCVESSAEHSYKKWIRFLERNLNCQKVSPKFSANDILGKICFLRPNKT